MRLTAWARLAKVASPSNAWAFGDTSSQSTRLGQSMGRSATVFNVFRPAYTPPATALGSAKLLAPFVTSLAAIGEAPAATGPTTRRWSAFSCTAPTR